MAVASPPVAARDVVVVQALDLSGLSNIGKDFSNGVRTYFESVNALGGIRGRKIQFIQLDDSGRASDATANMQKLLQENDVDAVIVPTSEETSRRYANRRYAHRDSFYLVRLRASTLKRLELATVC